MTCPEPGTPLVDKGAAADAGSSAPEDQRDAEAVPELERVSSVLRLATWGPKEASEVQTDVGQAEGVQEEGPAVVIVGPEQWAAQGRIPEPEPVLPSAEPGAVVPVSPLRHAEVASEGESGGASPVSKVPLTALHWPITPSHLPITPIHWPITPIHWPITPIHWPITPIHWPITPIHWPRTPIHWPRTPIHWPITPIHWPRTRIYLPMPPFHWPTTAKFCAYKPSFCFSSPMNPNADRHPAKLKSPKARRP